MTRYYAFRTFGCALFGLFLLGCAVNEPLTNFFVLGQSSTRRAGSPPSGGVAVFVRRVEVPGYLAKTSIVTMKGGIEVQYATTARWAEPLDQGIARAVADELSRHSRIKAYGFSPGAPPPSHDYDLWIRVERFGGNDNGDVVLRAHWQVSTTDSSAPIADRTANIRRGGWHPGDYPGLVRLLSEEVAEMSREIAGAIP